MTDLSTLMGTDPAPATTEPAGVPGMPPPGGAGPVGDPGVHPQDQSVPITGGRLVEGDRPPGTGPDHLGPQGQRTKAPWSTENEQAIPVNQRSAHDWTANRYTVNAGQAPIQIAGRLRGAVSTIVWVPAASPFGVTISPDEGDVQQGAGVQLLPGDSAEIASEGTVWCYVIAPNATGGPVQVIRTYNPPGGGLGLSST